MMDPQPFHPLVARLVYELNYPLISTPAGLENFLHQSGNRAIFCGGDAALYRECLDVAVVLPELDKALQGTVGFAVCSGEMEGLIKVRYGFTVWPSLVFVRDGEYTGTISGIQDWAVYLEKIAGFIDSPASRPPSVGIGISASGSIACH